MNIFFLDENPTLSAQYHVDKHVVKMILETAQLLCSVHHVTEQVTEQVTDQEGGQVRARRGKRANAN